MEIVVQILMLFVVIASVLKLSFSKLSYTLGVALACSAFVVLTYPYSIEQTRHGIAEYILNRGLRENTAILITLEALIFIAYAFARLEGGGAPSVRRPRTRLRAIAGYVGDLLLDSYPGVLILLVLFYIQTTLIFALPGVDFAWISYALALAVLVLIPTARYLLRLLLPERELRLETFFLVSLVVFVLGIITTVDEHIRSAPEVDLDWRGGAIALALFGVCFILGHSSYRLRRLLRRLISHRSA